MPNEMNEMDMVTTVTDVSKSGTGNQDFLKGGIAGVSLATVLVAGWHWVVKPMVKKARIKFRAAKAKRENGGDVPRDISQEYPVGK